MDLRSDKVHVEDLFCYRVFCGSSELSCVRNQISHTASPKQPTNLHPRINLHKPPLPPFHKKLPRPQPDKPARLRHPLCRLFQLSDNPRVEERSGRDLDNFLVAPLQGAVAGGECDCCGEGGEELDFDVAGGGDERFTTYHTNVRLQEADPELLARTPTKPRPSQSSL